MESFIFTNSRNETVTLTYEEPLWLGEWEEEGGAMVHLQKAPYQDGKTFIDSVLEPKFITINFEIFDDENVPKYRALMSSIFNPKLGTGLLVYQKENIKKEIHAISERLPYFPSGENNRVSYYQKGVINLICPNPYWKDPLVVSRALRAYQGGLTLPYTLPFELAVTGDSTILVNGGDAETPVKIDIQGPVTNPKITNNTTGKFILMNMSVAADEILHIDTTQRAIRAEIYRDGYAVRKVLGRRDSTSTFWQLEPGENEIQFIADAGGNDAAVAISWQNRYVGI